MPAKFTPRTPAQQKAYMERYARLGESTNASIVAILAAMDAGKDEAAIEAAARESCRSVLPPAEFRECYPDDPGPTLDEIPDDRPRLAAPGWSADRQRAFLTALAESGCVGHACAQVGLSRQSAYALRRREPHSVFAIGWDVAIQMARQALLDEATERALMGREQPVWHRGAQVGTRIVHNDRLLMFLLAHKPPPAHPVLSSRELMQLWPSLLAGVDRVLEPPLNAGRIAELTAPDDEGG